MSMMAEAIPNAISFDPVRNEIIAENNLVYVAAIFNPTGISNLWSHTYIHTSHTFLYLLNKLKNF